MIYLHTLGGAAIEIDAIRPGTEDAEGLAAPPRAATRIRLTASAPRRFALLLYLAVERGRRIGRERLQTLIFPDQPSSKARHSLREVIYQLRAAGAFILADHDDVVIQPDQVWCDAWAALDQDPLTEQTIHAITGGFLAGYAPEHSEAYAEWYEAYRATTISSLTRRLLAATTVATSEARWVFAERCARACLAIDPLNEGATLTLAGILAVNGSKATAIDLVDRYVAEVGPQSAALKFPAMALKRRISEGLPSRHLGIHRCNGGSEDAVGPMITPALVGRAAELSELHDTFGRARTGNAQCLVVAGAAGIGKTRLVAEFSAAAVLQGARVERVTIQPHDGERPMGAFVDLVPALLRARGAIGCSPASMEALRSLIGRQAQDDVPQQPAGAEEHEQRWAAVSRAVVDLCDAIASEGTLVLVVEDAHWLDTLSANTIGRIIGASREARIMVVATTRDPRSLVREMRLSERCRTLSLAPLDAAAARELLDTLLPASSGDENGDGGASIRARIAEVSAGNPLFLISLAVHSRAHPGAFKVPGTIVETFAQRIDALSRRAMSVLATCAELGKHSTVKRLVRSLEMRKHELVESLLELTDVGLVLRDGQSAIPAHPLVSEALRVRLAEPARRAVAHAVATTLEADAEGGASPSLWWDAAGSWRAADNPERAIYALKQCARHALEIGRPGETARIYEHATTLAQSPEQLRDTSESLMRAADAANEFGLVLRGAELLRSLCSAQSHDDLEIAEIHAFLSVNHFDASGADRLIACIRAAHATATHRVNAAITLLKLADMSGRGDLRSLAVGEIPMTDLTSVSEFVRLEFELLVASTSGDRRRAGTAGRALIQRFREADQQSSLLQYYISGAIGLRLAGFDSEATVEFERLFELSEQYASSRARLYVAVQLASIHYDASRDGEADAWMDRAESIISQRPDLATDFNFLTTRLEVAVQRGRLGQARELVNSLIQTLTYPNGLRRRWIDAGDLAIRSGCGELGIDWRDRLCRLGRSRLNSMSGLRDFEVAVVVEALLHLDLRADAHTVLTEYLESERADARQPTLLLSRAIKSVSNPPQEMAAGS